MKFDIIILQEHWLYNFEKKELSEFLDDFTCLVRATDDNDPISPYQRPRGMGGVAICYKQTLRNIVEEKPDGTERIAVVKILAIPKPLIIIGVYLPCRGAPGSDSQYRAALDTLAELLYKYSPTSNVLIIGDLNASLQREQPTTRDKMLIEFMRTHSLRVAADTEQLPTYYHPSGKSATQIDYILQNGVDQVKNHKVLERQSLNTSQHDPITCCTIVTTPIIIHRPSKINPIRHNLQKPRAPRWEKIDRNHYKANIEKQVANNPALVQSIEQDYINLSTSNLCALLREAADSCMGPNLPTHAKKKRQFPKVIKEACKISKEKFWKWKEAGKPKMHDNLQYLDMRIAKKQLRRLQRQHEATSRTMRYEKLMEAHEGDQSTFYKLIAEQRQDACTTTSYLLLDNERLTTTEQIREGWAKYFKDLGTPEPVARNNTYYNNEVELDILIIEEICNIKKEDHTPFTEAEIKKSHTLTTQWKVSRP